MTGTYKEGIIILAGEETEAAKDEVMGHGPQLGIQNPGLPGSWGVFLTNPPSPPKLLLNVVN